MFPETILLVTKDLVVLKEVHQVTMYDVFESFGVNRSMSVIVCNWFARGYSHVADFNTLNK